MEAEAASAKEYLDTVLEEIGGREALPMVLLQEFQSQGKETVAKRQTPFLVIPLDQHYFTRADMIDLLVPVLCPAPEGIQEPPEFVEPENPTQEEIKKMHSYLSSKAGRERLDLGHCQREARNGLIRHLDTAGREGRVTYLNPRTRLPGYEQSDAVISRQNALEFAKSLGIEVGANKDENQEQKTESTGTEPSQAIRDEIRAHLHDIATFAPSLDFEQMPGEKVDFHALLACMDAIFLSARPSTFDDYLRKPSYLCKFKRSGRNPDFYEGIAKKMGVNSGNYRRKLKEMEAIYDAAKRKRQSKAA